MKYLIVFVLSAVFWIYVSFTYGIRVNESWVAQECGRVGRVELPYAGKVIKCRMARKDEK